MPTCIYCLKTKPSNDFANEHVLTRAICGSGANWTLVDMVCAACNGALSKYESHWTASAIESLMRNFSGPLGRGGKGGQRSQPIELDQLFYLQDEDTLVYEAGMAFPAEFYFRPQVIDSPNGWIGIASDSVEGAAFQAALAASVQKPPFELTEPTDDGSEFPFQVTTVGFDSQAQRFTAQGSIGANMARGIWLRRMTRGTTINDMAGNPKEITRRLALDDRSRLFMRALDVGDACSFFDRILLTPASVRPTRSYKPGEQTVKLGFKVNLPLVFRCVLKTGLNLVTHAAGPKVAMDPAFNKLREEILDPARDADVMNRNRLLPKARCADLQWLDSFPAPSDDSQHRMMLDVHRGQIRFRVRLFGHLGYQCFLAPETPSIAGLIPKTRVVVDFCSTGIRMVERWPK